MSLILVVEDSAAMRTYVRSTLESAPELSGNVEVVEAASGFDALRLLPRGEYDLVITDINMPDINGLELIRYIRQNSHHNSEVPVLIISTQSGERDQKRGLALGADGFLAKPFSPEALRGAVVRSLAARAQNRAAKSSSANPSSRSDV